MVKSAEEAVEAARKAEEEKAEKSAVIRAEKARLMRRQAVTREALNFAAKAKAAAAANEVAGPLAAKDKEGEFQAAKIKEEATRHARKAKTVNRKEQADPRIGARPKKLRRQQKPTSPSARSGVLRSKQRRQQQ